MAEKNVWQNTPQTVCSWGDQRRLPDLDIAGSAWLAAYGTLFATAL